MKATNEYTQSQAASTTAAGALTGTEYHNRPALLCVPRERLARPRWPALIPLAGGGFEWCREVVLLDLLTRDLTLRDRAMIRRSYLVAGVPLADALGYADWIRERRGPAPIYALDRHEASALVLD